MTICSCEQEGKDREILFLINRWQRRSLNWMMKNGRLHGSLMITEVTACKQPKTVTRNTVKYWYPIIKYLQHTLNLTPRQYSTNTFKKPQPHSFKLTASSSPISTLLTDLQGTVSGESGQSPSSDSESSINETEHLT